MNLDHITKPVVVYHDRCLDGVCAAFLARLRWPDADLVPAALPNGCAVKRPVRQPGVLPNGR